MSSELGTKAEKNLDATVQGQHSAMGVNSGIHGKPHHEPMTTSGHKPGKLVGNDALPEHHIQVMSAGTAPAESTYAPGSGNQTSDTVNDPALAGVGPGTTTASATLGGSTSGDVYNANQLGNPVQGQSSAELRDGSKSGAGLNSVGAPSVPHSQSAKDPVGVDRKQL